MTCQQMDRIIASHSTLSGLVPEAAGHIAECESCQRLASVFDECRPAPKPSEERVKRIEAMMLQDLAPVQPLVPARVFFAALLLVCLTVVAVGSALFGTRMASARRRSEDRCLSTADGRRRYVGLVSGSAHGAGE